MLRARTNLTTAALWGLLILLLAPSASVAAESSVDTNVPFGTYSGLALLMDIYKPATPNGFGILLVNGSGWYRDVSYDAPLLKQSEEFRPATQKLLAAGYTVFVITHRASPRFHIADIVADVQRGARFIRANAARWGIRPDRLGALGGSSGGHLVSMLGTLDGKGDADASDPVERESAKVQCVVAFYPAIDLAKIDTPSGSVAVSLATGIRPPTGGSSSSSAAVKQYREASPVTYVTRDDPPFLLLHGDADKTVPFQQSEIMEAALKNAGVAVTLIRVPGAGHGTASPGWDKIDWSTLAVDWFETRLREGTPSAGAR
jgi:acetyl esterase/lipase